MKKIIIAVLYLIACSSVCAAEEVPLEEDLGTDICTSILLSDDVTKRVGDLTVERLTIRLKKLNSASSKPKKNIVPPTPKRIVEFFNKNKDKFRCANISTGKSGRHNIIKRAISEEDMIQLVIYDYFFKLSKEAGLKIDFNAVEKIDGEFETPLDYLLKEIARYEVGSSKYKELDRLKRRLTKRYGAKQFKDLPDAVRQQYIDKE